MRCSINCRRQWGIISSTCLMYIILYQQHMLNQSIGMHRLCNYYLLQHWGLLRLAKYGLGDQWQCLGLNSGATKMKVIFNKILLRRNCMLLLSFSCFDSYSYNCLWVQGRLQCSRELHFTLYTTNNPWPIIGSSDYVTSPSLVLCYHNLLKPGLLQLTHVHFQLFQKSC